MKKKLLLCATALWMTVASNSQTQKFDIASYTPPQGWYQLDSNGKRGFFNSKTVNGEFHFCQILLYQSRASSGNAVKDFNEEWNNKIVPSTGYTKKPEMQSKKSPDGWDYVTGYANITQQGATFTCTLTSISGFGKLMSILVNVAGADYLPFVDQFFQSLVLEKNGATSTLPNGASPGNTTRMGTLADYVFALPQGWRTDQYPDGLVLQAPPTNTGERCNITLWPMRSSSGNMEADANNLFATVFKDFDLANGSTQGSMIKGISSQGWEYFIIKKSIRLRGGDFQNMFGFAFVAKLGNQVAGITGISKDPLVSSCFGLQLTNVWPKFFYSLQFKNYQPGSQDAQMARRLSGVWMAVTASAGDRFVFAPNGRFAGAAAAQRYLQLSSTELLRVTDVYFGDGSYSLSGNGIVLTYDSDKNAPEKGLFRIEEESMDGRTWRQKLYLLRISAVDNAEYEVAYERQQ